MRLRGRSSAANEPSALVVAWAEVFQKPSPLVWTSTSSFGSGPGPGPSRTPLRGTVSPKSIEKSARIALSRVAKVGTPTVPFGDERAQLAEAGIEQRAGTGRGARVAVADHALERHLRARRVAAGRAARAGQGDLAQERLSVYLELPADVARERVERLGGRLGARMVGDARDAGRDRVEALRVGAEHGLVEPAGAALVEHAVLVDQRVVADVVPAVRVAMEAADREDDRRPLLRGVVVERDGVVDVDRADAAVAGRGARRALARAPLAARDEVGFRVLGRPGPRTRARLGELAGHVDEMQPQSRHSPAEAVLDRIGAAHPERVGRPPRALAGPGVGSVVGVRLQGLPAAPAATRPADPHRYGRSRAPTPAQADQIEAPRGRQRPRNDSATRRAGRGCGRKLEVEGGPGPAAGDRRQGEEGAQKRRCCCEQPHC